MIRTKHFKRIIISGLLTILLCSTMLVGTTYAWFQTSISDMNNRIETGDLDIGLYQVSLTDGALTETAVTADTEFFTDADWKPGAIYYENFHIKNEGSLSLKYKLQYTWNDWNFIKETAESTDGRSLKDVLQVALIEGHIASAAEVGAVQYTLLTGDLDGIQYIDSTEGADTDKVAMIVYWPAGQETNLYNVDDSTPLNKADKAGQNRLFAELGLSLSATQNNTEADSFGTDYDTEATDASWVNEYVNQVGQEGQAYFFCSVRTNPTDITIADYQLIITGEEAVVTADLSGEGELPETWSIENGMYTFAEEGCVLFRLKATGTASIGYCKIDIESNAADAEGTGEVPALQSYYTQPIEIGTEYVFGLTAAAGTKVSFEGCWGTYEYAENMQIVANTGEIVLINPPEEPEEEPVAEEPSVEPEEEFTEEPDEEDEETETSPDLAEE